MQLTLVLTHACNLRCAYCYTGEKKPVRMPSRIGRRAIDFALEQRPRNLTLAYFGGEPMLEFALMRELTAYARERTRAASVPFDIIMTTNGTLLTDEALAELATWPFEPSLSLDGVGPAHDVGRPFIDGRGSYDVVIDALQRTLRVFPHLILMMVVDPANVGALADSVAQLVEMGARRLRFSIDFQGSWTEPTLATLGAQIGRAADLYVEYFRRGLPVSMAGFDDRLRVHLKGGATAADHCDLGMDEIAVAPSGWIYPCERMVGEDTDERARIGHLDQGFDAPRRAYFGSARPSGKAEMEALGLGPCGMWCGCTNYLLTGAPDRVPEVFRRYQTVLVREALRAGTTLFQEQNPFFLGVFYGEDELLARAAATAPTR